MTRDLQRQGEMEASRFHRVARYLLDTLKMSPNALGDENLDFLEPVYNSNLGDAKQNEVPFFVNVVVGSHLALGLTRLTPAVSMSRPPLRRMHW